MTPQEIRDAIAASAELQALAAAEGGAATQAIADALSVGLEDETREVEAWRAKRYFVKRLKWRAIVAASENHAVPMIKAACQVAVDLAEDARMVADFADPSAVPMWAALIAENLCTEAERDEIVGWCQIKRVVTHTEVGAALHGA